VSGENNRGPDEYTQEDLQRLIGKVAGRLHARFTFIPMDDLYQEGWTIALTLKHRYDKTRKTDYSTWLVWVVATRLLDYINHWAMENGRLPYKLRKKESMDVLERLVYTDLLGALESILSPMAWRATVLKIEAAPNRVTNRMLEEQLQITNRTRAAVVQEIKNGITILNAAGEN
jgi:hypothetical protein